jgi:hypothetical protein
MFEVLVYLYENYWRPDACPDHDQLSRKLSAVGFETDEIQEALVWLDGLAENAQAYAADQSADSLRVYSTAEIDRLGEDSIGFVSFLESAGVLPPAMRDAVAEGLDRSLFGGARHAIRFIAPAIGSEPAAALAYAVHALVRQGGAAETPPARLAG